MKYKNPIIPGFNPDPSICRVGDDFYLATSSFEYFPGVPVYHSKNLVNWELVGHCLTRDSQLPLEGCVASKGIYAPTIRYHNDTFYMINTNAACGHYIFLVHTTDINGEWSEPVMIKNMRGLDPSLFWDEDGTCYCCMTALGILLYVVDPKTGEVLSEVREISKGCGGSSAEAAHIYKRNGWYYLMLAEGGTEYGHRVTVQRSRNIWGPYEDCPANPILTHMNNDEEQIQGVGHADIVEDQNGNWWMVCLGFRKFGGTMHHNLGRETFLTPIEWSQSGWPEITDKRIKSEMDAPLPAPVTAVNHSVNMDLTKAKIDQRFVYVRNPNQGNYRIDTNNRTLTLVGDGERISDEKISPILLCLRQPDFNTLTRVEVDLEKCKARRFGICAFHMSNYHYDLYLSRVNEKLTLNFSKHINDIEVRTASIPFDKIGPAILFIATDIEKYVFGFESESGERIVIGEGSNVGLSSENTIPRSYTGTMLGVFCEDGTGVINRFTMTAEAEE